MNKKHKIELCLRGALRTAVSAGAVAGFRNINPGLCFASMVGGYIWVVYGLEHTARKIKEKELPPTKPISYYYCTNIKEPKRNIFERVETKIVDTIMEKTEQLINIVKKRKLAINSQKHFMKDSQENQLSNENKLNM